MINNLIRIEKQPRLNGGPRTVYILKCADCEKTIKVRKNDYDKKKHSLKCQICSHRKKPFESLFNTFRLDHRKIINTLSFTDFLNFTKQKNCHYCNNTINWIEYPTVGGKFNSNAYYLDRKDNSEGYSVENCVVCCTKCNLAKGNRYTYEEWHGMTKYFREKI